MGTVDAPRNAPSIVVVGSTMIDLVAYAQRLPGPGETVLGDRFGMGFGGKGANQAVMARLLGADVAMVNCLGDDSYGELTLANFATHVIDMRHVRRVPGSSGVAHIWVEADGTNRIIIVPGANAALSPAEAATALTTMPRVDVVLAQFEIAQEVTEAAFRAARSRGANTILNPAPAAALDPGLLGVTDWLIPNEGEFAIIAVEAGGEFGGGVAADRALEAKADLAHDDDALRAFATRFRVRLVVTLGERGAALLGTDGVVRRVPAPAVTSVDSTGAGDAFVGGFAFALASGLDEVAAVRLGCAVASDSVQRPGTQSSYPDADRCRALVAALAA